MALTDLLAPALQIGSTILSAGSQLARGDAASVIGRRRKAQAEYEADQLEQEAEASRGVGLRGGADAAMQTQLVNSAAIARAAASGAGASDPTVVNIIARTAGEGAYRQALALYEGEAQARMDRMKATALRYEGATAEADSKFARNQSRIGAASTLLSGGVKFTSMYDKYWAGPKKGDSDTDFGN